MNELETDYLIIGAGAVGLAFADTLIDEDPDCHITFVDKHAKPGGHWNDAYGFVALHQPAQLWCHSQEFSRQIDSHGPNKGLHALASGTEVLAYFEKVMNMRLLPTGRVSVSLSQRVSRQNRQRRCKSSIHTLRQRDQHTGAPQNRGPLSTSSVRPRTGAISALTTA